MVSIVISSAHGLYVRGASGYLDERDESVRVVDKVYTLVERDEVATWVKLGFSKEGSIPAFYKRSDAFLLGCMVLPAAPPRDRDEVPTQSETRLIAARPAGAPAPLTPAQDRMERTIVAAKKAVKDGSDRALPPAKVTPASEADARKAVAAALRCRPNASLSPPSLASFLMR